MKQYVFEGFEFCQKWKLLRMLPRKLKGFDKQIKISLKDTIRQCQYDSLWYGGLVATVQCGDLIVDVEALGDVCADLYERCDREERHLEYIKDKNNVGEFGSAMQFYIQTDKELYELINAEHRHYYLDMLNNNWWECVPYHKDDEYQPESWLTEGDGIWCAIAEAVDYLSMEG